MPLFLVSLFSGAVTLVLLAFAGLAWRQFGNRPERVAAHSRTAPRPEPAGGDRVVRLHPVQDRLMDASTSRLHPSERHRVPPWIAPSRRVSTRAKS